MSGFRVLVDQGSRVSRVPRRTARPVDAVARRADGRRGLQLLDHRGEPEQARAGLATGEPAHPAAEVGQLPFSAAVASLVPRKCRARGLAMIGVASVGR
ncbi:MAG TPA: hypothetical protein VJ914_24360 [Pseudonocardiaceae bacterium]|nr:hypothetical protein [Pseudonocardiaceae bacterium]